jgi:hypothetical protein
MVRDGAVEPPRAFAHWILSPPHPETRGEAWKQIGMNIILAHTMLLQRAAEFLLEYQHSNLHRQEHSE